MGVNGDANGDKEEFLADVCEYIEMELSEEIDVGDNAGDEDAEVTGSAVAADFKAAY